MYKRKRPYLFILSLVYFLFSPVDRIEVRKSVVVNEKFCHDIPDREVCVKVHCVKKTIHTVSEDVVIARTIEEKNRYWTAEQIKKEYLHLNQNHIEEIKEKKAVRFYFDNGTPFKEYTVFTHLSSKDEREIFEIRLYSILPVGTPVCPLPEGWD